MAAGTKVGTAYVDLEFRTKGMQAGISKMNKGMQQMSASAAKGVAGAKKSFGGLQGFVGKIAHYIQFTIGVQLVMGIKRAFEEIITIFKEFEKSMYNAAAVSGYLGKAFDDAVDSIQDLTIQLARKSIFTVREVGVAMYDLASAGIDPVTTSAEDLIPILNYAQATQTDLKDALYATLVAMKQFSMGLEESGEMVDSWMALITNSFMTMEKFRDAFRYTGQIAGTLGQDFQGLNAAITLLADRGYEGGQAGQRLNMIFNKLLSPTDKGQRALAALGISMSDIDPTSRDLVDILTTLNKANFKAADATNMFRARTAAAAITLVDNVDIIKDYIILQKQMGGITESIAEKQMQTLDATFKQLQSSAEELAISIGDRLASSLKTLQDVGGMIGEELSGALGGVDLGEILSPKVAGVNIAALFHPITGFMELMDMVKREIVEPKKALEDWVGGLRRFSDAGEDGSTVLQDLGDNLVDYGNKLDKVNKIRQEMSKLDKDSEDDALRWNDLNQQLIQANTDLAKSEGSVITTSNEILDIMVDMHPEIANGIAAYQNYATAQREINNVTARRDKLLQEQIDLEQDLNDITRRQGVDNEAYRTTYNRLSSVKQQIIDLNEEERIKTEAMNEAYKNYEQVMMAASGATAEYIRIASQIIDLTGELYQAQQDYSDAMSEYTRLLDLAENKEKYLAEAMLDVYELQDKLYEIESERYSLAQDKKDLDEEMFDALAEQGLLTEEIIEEYKEWQQAEGDLAKARAAFAKGEITEEELQAYIEAAAKEQADYNQLLIGTEDNVGGIVGEYIEMGAASGDIVRLYYDMLDKSNDHLQIEEEKVKVENELADAVERYNDLADEDVSAKRLEDAKAAADGFLDEIQRITGELSGLTVDIQLQIDQGQMPDFRGPAAQASQGFIAGFMERFGGIIGPIVNVFRFIAGLVKPILKGIIDFIVPLWSMVVTAATTAFNMIKAIAIPIINAIKAILIPIWQIFQEVAYTAWTVINNIATPIIGAIRNILLPIWQAFEQAARFAWTIIGQIANPIMNGIKYVADLILTVFNKIANVLNKVASKVSGVLSTIRSISSAVGGAIGSLFGEQGIVALKQGARIVRGPQPAIIGERGAEAVVPLEGVNRKYGQQILQSILPRYFPEMTMYNPIGTGGGITDTVNNTYATDNYNITGPITVVSRSPQDFMEQMKYQYRASRRR